MLIFITNYHCYIFVIRSKTRSTQRAQASLAEADHYSYILPTVKMLSLGCERLPPPPPLKKKAWFLRTFEFSINFTVLDILLGIPNHGKNKAIDILNFVILFAKSYIYNSKKDEMAIDLYTFLVKLNRDRGYMSHLSLA